MDGTGTEPRLTARAIVAQARELEKAGKVRDAVQLLLEQQLDIEDLPPTYNALTARLLLREGDEANGRAYLARAQAKFDEEMQAPARRDLAEALMSVGEVEAAGEVLATFAPRKRDDTKPPVWMARSAVAAVAAFERRGRSAAGAWVMLARAEWLAEHGREADALALLEQHRDDWPTLPRPYVTAIRRLSGSDLEREAEVAGLLSELDEAIGSATASAATQLGDKLLKLGRTEQAGKAFSWAIEAGAKDLSFYRRIAASIFREATSGPPVESSFHRSFTYVDTEKHLIYVAVAKNASTLLKANFALNSSYRQAYLEARGAIHVFARGSMVSPINRDAMLDADYFRFTLLRDPYRRLLSAYLQKFVRRWSDRAAYLKGTMIEETIRGAQAMIGIGFDPVRSISFEEFVRYFATMDDIHSNPHWLPQYRFTGRDLSLYNHVGVVERLQATLDLLSERFGFVTESDVASDMRGGGTRHIAKYSEAEALEAPHRALPQALDEREENLPPPDQFYTPELRAIVAQRYAIDLANYEAVIGAG